MRKLLIGKVHLSIIRNSEVKIRIQLKAGCKQLYGDGRVVPQTLARFLQHTVKRFVKHLVNLIDHPDLLLVKFKFPENPQVKIFRVETIVTSHLVQCGMLGEFWRFPQCAIPPPSHVPLISFCRSLLPGTWGPELLREVFVPPRSETSHPCGKPDFSWWIDLFPYLESAWYVLELAQRLWSQTTWAQIPV